MEVLWACLLVVAGLHRSTRPLAFLLAAKWGLNYAAFEVMQWAPVFIDMVIGFVLIALTVRHAGVWARVVSGAAVLTMVAHGGYWVFWDNAGDTGALSYYFMAIGLFTAQALAVAWPGTSAGVERVIRWVGRPRGRGVAGFAAEPVTTRPARRP